MSRVQCVWLLSLPYPRDLLWSRLQNAATTSTQNVFEHGGFPVLVARWTERLSSRIQLHLIMIKTTLEDLKDKLSI